jgi:hypothetical protein
MPERPASSFGIVARGRVLRAGHQPTSNSGPRTSPPNLHMNASVLLVERPDDATAVLTFHRPERPRGCCGNCERRNPRSSSHGRSNSTSRPGWAKKRAKVWPPFAIDGRQTGRAAQQLLRETSDDRQPPNIESPVWCSSASVPCVGSRCDSQVGNTLLPSDLSAVMWNAAAGSLLMGSQSS